MEYWNDGIMEFWNSETEDRRRKSELFKSCKSLKSLKAFKEVRRRPLILASKIVANIHCLPEQGRMRSDDCLHLLISCQALGCNLTAFIEACQKIYFVGLKRK